MALQDCLEQIDARDDAVRAWTYIDRGALPGIGALAGLVLGVKDVIDVKDMPTAYGSPIFADNMATTDADCVAMLRAAGATVLGKTVTAEFATYHPGPTVNPCKAGHTPGGSSSGSAAVVADRQADVALGTQTAGSIIRPATYCGILGFKPSFGRYPLKGVLVTAPSLDTLGLFARSIEILDTADAVLSGDRTKPQANRALAIGLCRSPAWSEADVEMQDAFLSFAQQLVDAGHSVVERELPEACDGLANAQALIHRREAWSSLGHIRYDHPNDVSDVFRDMIDQGAAESAASYEAALALQSYSKMLLPQIFDGLDMLLTPGATGAAPVGLQATGNPAFQRVWTALGVPCLGFPVFWRADGLPLGLQAVGAPGSDRQLLANATTLIELATLKESRNAADC